jgi:hypothetical protein
VATTQEAGAQTRPVYAFQGTLIEACSCGVLCPCWVGEDPDHGECYAIVAYNFDAGEIEGLDVSGLSFVSVAHIPGNILAGNWEVVVFVDSQATDEQREALLAAFTGKLGGPLADLAQLIGTVKGVEIAPIRHEVVGGIGSMEIPGVMEAVMEPYRSPDGSVTVLQNSIFSTVPGSPAWVSKASKHRVNLPQYGMTWEYEGRNAIQSEWTMQHAA